MTEPRRTVTVEESDVHEARRFYPSFQRAGACRRVKRRTNRRERREGKRATQRAWLETVSGEEL